MIMLYLENLCIAPPVETGNIKINFGQAVVFMVMF